MKKRVTCIDCPKGCVLTADTENGKVLKVSGNECPKGEEYAMAEIENPVRILTSTVVNEGLSLKMIPVRTDRPIPKGKMMEAMRAIRKLRVARPVDSGEAIVKGFLGLEADLIVTRSCDEHKD